MILLHRRCAREQQLVLLGKVREGEAGVAVRGSEVYIASENGLHDGSGWVAGVPRAAFVSVAVAPSGWRGTPYTLAASTAGDTDGPTDSDATNFELPSQLFGGKPVTPSKQ